ncbi:MAG: hypothetical protein WB774_06695 [Xanthobacteraceae bacterium]
MVARNDFAHARTDAFDDARAFMAEYDRQRHRIDLVANDDIGVAHAGRDNAHQHSIGARRFDGKLFDRERAAFLANDCGLDGAVLRAALRR